MGPPRRAQGYKENSQVFPAIRQARRKGDVPPRYQKVRAFNPDHQSVGGKSDSPGRQIHTQRLRPHLVNE